MVYLKTFINAISVKAHRRHMISLASLRYLKLIIQAKR